jgi:hypothetical protein
MEASPARRRFAVLGAVVLAAMMFAWVAVVNGYPLVFNDSSRYLDGAIRRYIPSESPIFYGVFMIPFHLDGVSLWPVAGGRCPRSNSCLCDTRDTADIWVPRRTNFFAGFGIPRGLHGRAVVCLFDNA